MANIQDWLRATMNIARADIGAGQLAGAGSLTGKDVPIRRQAEFLDSENQDNLMPIATVFAFVAPLNAGAPAKLLINAQFDAFVPLGSDGLENQILERVEFVMTAPNFAAEGLDVGPFVNTYRPLDGLEHGRRRMALDMTFELTR